MEIRSQPIAPRSQVTVKQSIRFDTPQLQTDAVTLERLLSRLSDKILSSSPNPQLLHSRFERTKTAAVRTSLTHVELILHSFPNL